MPACTTTRSGRSEVTSDATRLVLRDIDGKEFRRARLGLRSVPWPCEDPGVTRMDGVRLNIFSTTVVSAADGGRDGAREAGRDPEVRSPPGWTNNNSSPSNTGIRVPPRSSPPSFGRSPRTVLSPSGCRRRSRMSGTLSEALLSSLPRAIC